MLLFCLVLLTANVAVLAIAESMVSWRVPGLIVIEVPELNLKLFNDADGVSQCSGLSWRIVTGEAVGVQAKYLKNAGSKDLTVWWSAELPQGFSLDVAWYGIVFVNGDWSPTEPGTHMWAANAKIPLRVGNVIVVTLRLNVNNASIGSYGYSLTFSGSG
jgi:hypothetical protein